MAKPTQFLERLPAPSAISTSVALVGLITTASVLHLLRLTLAQPPAALTSSTTANTSTSPRPSKPVSASSVSYRTKIGPDACDEHGRCYGGELLKIIDVSAGVVAAKHAEASCLTISADRVIFLQEIKVGDVLHISAGVNRAWSTSMEIGVRVMREAPEAPSEESYCCHAYLTFVTKPINPSLTRLDSFLTTLNLRPPAAQVRVQVAPIEPRSMLESKRFLLAGRRRAHRIKASKGNDDLLVRMRKQVAEMVDAQEQETEGERGDGIEKVQEEMIVEAYLRGDEDVRIEGDTVVASIEGFMEPVRIPLSAIERAANSRGHGGFRKLATPSAEEVDKAAGHVRPVSGTGRSLGNKVLEMEQTVVTSLYTVRPQHCNSKSVLFGGTLMRWIEEISAIAARRVHPGPWASASIDSLTFKSSAKPGEVVYLRAVVTKSYNSSVEVWATATAEDRNAPISTPRVISDAFFSLVAIDPVSGRPLRGVLKGVRVREGTAAAEVASGAGRRREERLVDKRVLQRVYA